MRGVKSTRSALRGERRKAGAPEAKTPRGPAVEMPRPAAGFVDAGPMSRPQVVAVLVDPGAEAAWREGALGGTTAPEIQN